MESNIRQNDDTNINNINNTDTTDNNLNEPILNIPLNSVIPQNLHEIENNDDDILMKILWKQ